MATSAGLAEREEFVATLHVPWANTMVGGSTSTREGKYVSGSFSLASFERPTGNLACNRGLPEVSEEWLRPIRVLLAGGMVLKLIEDVSENVAQILPRFMESLASGSALAASYLQSGIEAAILGTESFGKGAASLTENLLRFPEITKDWPEFARDGFPQRSIEKALQFLEDVWNLAGRRGQEALTTAFCGPSEDGSVNCQWRREGRFLGVTIPADGPREAYFSDRETNEEWEGVIDPRRVANWIERF